MWKYREWGFHCNNVEGRFYDVLKHSSEVTVSSSVSTAYLKTRKMTHQVLRNAAARMSWSAVSQSFSDDSFPCCATTRCFSFVCRALKYVHLVLKRIITVAWLKAPTTGLWVLFCGDAPHHLFMPNTLYCVRNNISNSIIVFETS